MVFGPHDRIDIPVHGIVYVCCPDCGEENKQHVRYIVAGNEKEADDIGRSLKYTINRVECYARPGRQGFGFVVFVMFHVDVFVQEFVGVERAVHPVDSDLDAGEVYDEPEKVGTKATNFR